MKYFGTADKYALRRKQIHRALHMQEVDAALDACEAECATKDQRLEVFFLSLAGRLLRAKFWSVPGYTNEELSYLTGCSSGTYLALIMTRQKRCSRDLALLMHENLKKLENKEGMPPLPQPAYPE